MGALHSQKIKDEKNAFIDELYQNITPKMELSTSLDSRACRLHSVIIPVYIMKNYCANSFISPFLDIIITNLIESECLFFLGFTNTGMSSLRSALESSFKFIYYEHHPIENQLLLTTGHYLSSKEYREFFYIFPSFSQISFLQKEKVESLWENLCKYVHSDIHVIKELSVVSEISTILNYSEKDFNIFIARVKYAVKIIVSIMFAINSKWAINIEKAYFDAILEAFDIDERNEIKTNLAIE